MLKIWAKVIKDDKIKKDVLFKKDKSYSRADFMDYLYEICHGFDIPTPVVLKNHKQNFAEFNIARFRTSDFIESVDFDTLILENHSD